jgi:hypothetical protein
MAAAVAEPDPINGGPNGAAVLAHRAVDEAFIKRVAEMWSVLMRDASHHHDKIQPEAIKRWNTGYKLAVYGRSRAHEMIDQYS